MKALVALTLVLVLTGANAGFLDKIQETFGQIKNTFANVFKSITPVLGQAANNVLSELKKDGASILSSGLQALTHSAGKRDLAILDKVGQFIQKGESAIGDLSTLIGNIFNKALTELTQVAQHLGEVEIFNLPLSDILHKIDNIVANHNILQGGILKTLIEHPADILSEAVQHIMGALSHHKRSGVLDSLKSIGSQIAGQFTPFINTVTQHITNIGSALKNVGSTLLGAIKPSIDALKGKLSTHIDTLKNVGTTLLGHGKNAISALTDAVTDILGQTFKNAQPTIQKAVETAKDAGSVAINHLTSTLTGGH
ncbi:hypothetical protein LOTGIDRAFT_232951 [Lottia gigantea]|uniref:Uncharacterized protein n=1 Tax=Lottia gigantea TaxID=225164 RepID=V4AHK7_LOTGI|nr:hypothetical protein LOTGIDRAFT_232951 [Lottia gigantea]ESO92861.1 hypothetical protein LOTGIDRAFT_232951 [Lottia gigantea]